METVHINGKEYPVELILKNRGRSASARLRDGKIVIRIPKRAPESERTKIYENLRARCIRSIEKGRWREKKKLKLEHGGKVQILGKEYEVKVIEGKNRKVKIDGNMIIARTPDGNGIAERLGRAFLPEVEKRTRELNATHFNSEIASISLRNNRMRWGSCGRDGRISLSTRLLFTPPEILDYVIVHELAHTKVKSHGERFWGLVAKAMPDHADKRAWLRKNDSEIPTIVCRPKPPRTAASGAI
ncbi:DUF45 domain-containing protein [Candidatus Micrarchaeota archaeon]|nr:DUF45 domain-containing protein [Candidatus Micrarchaeota archaeon]